MKVNKKDNGLSNLPLLFHKIPITIIEAFHKSTEGLLSKKNSVFSNTNANLNYSNEGYQLTFNLKRSSITSRLVGDDIKKISFHTVAGEEFIINTLFLTSSNSNGDNEGFINTFQTEGFQESTNYYFRLIIPLRKEIKYHFAIEDTIFHSDLGYYSRTGTKAIVNGNTIHANVIHSGTPKKFYLSIESFKKERFDEFSEKAFALQKGIGFLTGHLAGTEGYFFAYSNKKMQIPKHYGFHTLRKTLKSIYNPVHTNPFGYLYKNRKVAQKYYDSNILQPVSLQSFSTLCQKLYDSLEFSSAILLLLESCSASLIFMPGGLAIALENLSDLIIGEDKFKLAPMSKATSKKVRKECADILNKYSEEINPNSLKVLLARIDQINQTTNKERLKAPFTKLSITLNDEDLKVLESRNDFLHGRVPDFTNEGMTRSLDRINKDLYYASMKFYTLVSMLILKWVNFDNYILNHPKIRETQCGVKLAEEHYRRV